MIDLLLFSSRSEAIDWAYKNKMTVWSDVDITEAKSRTTVYHLTTLIYSNYMDAPVAFFWKENYRIIPKSQSINSNRKGWRSVKQYRG